MDKILALNSSSGQSIPVVLPPTFKIFAPLLLSNIAAIKSIPSTTHPYGPHPRQELDVYRSPTDSPSTPILIFVHGGGLTHGDKILPLVPEGLAHANVGAFFAEKGVTTIVPNYRRVDSEDGGEGAVFPSGGEDVSLMLEWLCGFMEEERDVYLLGNSAGGVHISTFLLSEIWVEQRRRYAAGGEGIVLKGVVNLAVPCHYKIAHAGRAEVLKKYYGDEKESREKCLCGLLESIKKSGRGKKELGIPKKMYIGIGEFDPDDEIADSMREFAKAWEETFGEDGLVVKILDGQNHISPPLSLMSGDKEGDRWGEDVVEWIQDA
ncbi:Alpha/Beta hydrolase protein [Rhexocercosporidium sp. MPI-PUGE-AT-0058]|nr:Alpha/Beta hydrolase protein [Rhexocercosporidium sp. MPI-PUGE-AT-0058]